MIFFTIFENFQFTNQKCCFFADMHCMINKLSIFNFDCISILASDAQAQASPLTLTTVVGWPMHGPVMVEIIKNLVCEKRKKILV